jgi:hypothetical protein
MNIGSVSSFFGAGAATRQNPFKAIKQDFQKLGSALKSGDLKGAQEAYAQLKNDLPASKDSSGTSPSSQPRTDLDAIGSALQSNDLPGAQKAFATFQQDVKATRGAHGHHHHHDSDGDADDAGSSANKLTTTTTAGALDAQA